MLEQREPLINQPSSSKPRLGVMPKMPDLTAQQQLVTQPIGRPQITNTASPPVFEVQPVLANGKQNIETAAQQSITAPTRPVIENLPSIPHTINTKELVYEPPLPELPVPQAQLKYEMYFPAMYQYLQVQKQAIQSRMEMQREMMENRRQQILARQAEIQNRIQGERQRVTDYQKEMMKYQPQTPQETPPEQPQKQSLMQRVRSLF